MPVPKAVFLDVGWTLVYPRESIWEAMAAVAREAGGALTGADAEGFVHGLVTAAREQAVARVGPATEYTDSDEEFLAMFTTMGGMIFTAAGIADDHARLMQRFFQRFWTGDNWAVFPEVFTALDRLRERGVRVGAVSNASSDLVGFLDQLGLSRRLDFAVVSAVEGTKKPDRRIFDRALRRAGVAAEEAVHVGDMYIEDILGARNVGVRALLMERGPRAMFPSHAESMSLGAESVEVVRNLEDVLAAIGVN